MTARRLTERQLARAIARGDRIAAINLAQRLWHAGDLRRTAVVSMYLPTEHYGYSLDLPR